jgi:hypothetical protein
MTKIEANNFNNRLTAIEDTKKQRVKLHGQALIDEVDRQIIRRLVILPFEVTEKIFEAASKPRSPYNRSINPDESMEAKINQMSIEHFQDYTQEKRIEVYEKIKEQQSQKSQGKNKEEDHRHKRM